MSSAAEPAPAALGPEDLVAGLAGPAPGIGLCLSGGGYRAMLFHIGALWRLNELGLLTRIDRISSVSGGSITAGWLALCWARNGWGTAPIAVSDFRDIFAAGLLRLASRTIDIPSILLGLLPRHNVGREIAIRYDDSLFGGATLQNLPDKPRFVINASNLQTGALWRFSQSYMGDYKVGLIEKPHLPLATAVAASSAFPPFLSPIEIKLDAAVYQKTGKETLQYEPFTTRPVLSDGGVYDNLGLETIFKRYATVLVSDGGAPFAVAPNPARVWPRQLFRVLNCIDNQVRSLRKRDVLHRLSATPGSGSYWGIGTPLSRYPKSVLQCSEAATCRLASVPTRLAALSSEVQRQLINWGYAACASSVESHFPQPGPAAAWPFPHAVPV